MFDPNYLWLLVPVGVSASVYAAGAIWLKATEPCKHVIYPDDPVCILCEKTIGDEHFS